MHRRANTPITVGKIKFIVEYRQFSWNEGAVIRVFFFDGDNERQVLKFDPLIHNPHCHFDPDGKDLVRSIKADDPLVWSLSQIGERMIELFCEAGYEKTVSQIDQQAIRQAVPEIENLLRVITPKH